MPGGRIRKSETLDTAFARLTRAELGVEIARSDCRLLGVYEHLYEDSVFGEGDGAPSTHYVVLGYAVPHVPVAELPSEQHTCYAWFEPAEVLGEEAVHPNTKAYMQDIGSFRSVGTANDCARGFVLPTPRQGQAEVGLDARV